MHNIHGLATNLRSVYRYQPGLVRIELEGAPAKGLRYKFDDAVSARKFMLLLGVLRSHGNEFGELWAEGCDVVEVWR
jgi:hypothetical protein